jgi:hypothetical protein
MSAIAPSMCDERSFRHCEEHLRRSNPVFAGSDWIASRSLSSGGASRRLVGSQ